MAGPTTDWCWQNREDYSDCRNAVQSIHLESQKLNHALMKAPLQGIIPPMVTPLRARDLLDVVGLERLIERLIRGGVSGIFILGPS